MTFLTKIFGDPNAKALKTVEPFIVATNEWEASLKDLSLEDLRNKTTHFKERIKNGESLDDILPEAFALVREVSWRVNKMRHFDVQLIGGAVLHRGHIAEMRTGEGKTLVATLAAYLNALAGKGVHVVTVNDYLARRDAVWMGHIYSALGLSVGIIQNQFVSYRFAKQELADVGNESVSEAYKVEYEFLTPCTRKEAYLCDITYGTNNEFGFDYLRDNMVGSVTDMVQRPLYYAIVDETDSILIDEARTPLIISAPAEEATDRYTTFARLVDRLTVTSDYNVDEKMRAVTLTDEGIKKMEEWLGVGNIYAEGGIATVHHVEQALRARVLFKNDRDYVVQNGEVVIVDEFTGRKMPGRRYSEGLHQAIEAKEGVAIQRESRTMATITFQNYFRLYEKLSGMTGTAVTEAEEFAKIYKLEVVVIPTNRKNLRQDHPDRIYKTEAGKFSAIADEVKVRRAKGQPVLIGTISVEKNEMLSGYLTARGITHEILNAKNHEREGEIIAQAGRPGAITLATNMAGRGVDIIMGGNPPVPELAEQARAAGGLFVIGTERHESRRIDNQLRGRAARQGDMGETQFFLSTEDDLMRIFAGERIRSVMTTLRVPEDMPIENKLITRTIEAAQRKVEGFHFDARKHLLEYDDVLNRHREVIYGERRKILGQFHREHLVLESGLENAHQHVPTAEEPHTLRELIFQNVHNELERLVSFHMSAEENSAWNMKGIQETVETMFPLTLAERDYVTSFVEQAENKLDAARARTTLLDKFDEWAKEKYEQLLVGRVPSLAVLLEVEKHVLLSSLDNLWVEHLVAVDYLRAGIGLRGYGQRDPLVEYKRETYRMFQELLGLIQKEVAFTIFKVGAGLQFAPEMMEKNNLILKGATDMAEGDRTPASAVTNDQNVGRNDPCPCGSGKKFKKCHGNG